MIDDLELDVELRALPTVRDEDGLALSSRNDRLSPDERATGRALPRALATRDRNVAIARLDEAGAQHRLRRGRAFDPPILAGAVRVGSARLIDNVPLEERRK